MSYTATRFSLFAAHHIPGATAEITTGERTTYSIEAGGIKVDASSPSAAVKAWKRRAAKASEGGAP